MTAMKQNSTETLDHDSSAATSASQKSWLNFKYPVHLGFLAIVRITVGYHFLSVGAGKLFGNFLTGDGLLRTLSGVAGDPIWRGYIFGYKTPILTIEAGAEFS